MWYRRLNGIATCCCGVGGDHGSRPDREAEEMKRVSTSREAQRPQLCARNIYPRNCSSRSGPVSVGAVAIKNRNPSLIKQLLPLSPDFGVFFCSTGVLLVLLDALHPSSLASVKLCSSSLTIL